MVRCLKETIKLISKESQFLAFHYRISVFFNLFWLKASFGNLKKLAAPFPVKKITICITLSGKTLKKTIS